MSICKGIARRVVAVIGMDVYRAFGVLLGLESGPIEPVPLTEDAPLRQELYPLRDIAQRMYNFPDDYDKILVERVVMGEPDLPGTVLRLPLVYGPGDYPLHRLSAYLKRMDDKRPAILLDAGIAQWHGTWGYVEEVAAAIAMAVADDRAAGRIYNTGRIYNIGEAKTYPVMDWIRDVGRVAGWDGEVVTVPQDRLPPYLAAVDVNTEQHWIIDTTRIRRELGHQESISREEALKRTIDWDRLHPPAAIDPDMFDYAAEKTKSWRS
jgi:nucleoside-diphosphate-sugar epimerase